MDGASVAMMFGAGIAGGIVTAIAGGSSLITFPALLAAGLPPIVANASNAVGLLPGNFMAGFADPESMPRWNRSRSGCDCPSKWSPSSKACHC